MRSMLISAGGEEVPGYDASSNRVGIGFILLGMAKPRGGEMQRLHHIESPDDEGHD